MPVTGALRNHTPHPLVVELDGRVRLVLAPQPPTPRAVVSREPDGILRTPAGPVRLTRTATTGQVVDLPPPLPGVLLVVARAVAEAAGRDDLAFPDELVRDPDGNVVACRALGRVRRA